MPVSPTVGSTADPFGQHHLLAIGGGLQFGEHARALRDELAVAIEAVVAPLRFEFSAMRRALLGLLDKAEGLLSNLASPARALAVLAGFGPDEDEVIPLTADLDGLALDSPCLRLGETTNEAWSAPTSYAPMHDPPISGMESAAAPSFTTGPPAGLREPEQSADTPAVAEAALAADAILRVTRESAPIGLGLTHVDAENTVVPSTVG